MTERKELKVAFLTENGFEQVELTSPREALEKEGIKTEIISPQKGKVKAWNHKEWGIELPVDKSPEDARPEDYDALILPGGVMNPDKLRTHPEAVNFVKAFMGTGKTLAAICHGPQTMIETKMLNGKKMTSYPSLRTDLENAGVNWVDEACVEDGSIISSRNPDDLPAFNQAILKALGK